MTGTKVATTNDKNNNDWETKPGNISAGKSIPIKIDLEKSGLGNNSKPAINPTIIDTYTFFSKNVFE